MRENFAAALKIELVFEGGMDDDPVDPGGRTKNGITQKVYASYRRRKGLAARDVFQMVDSERDEIYRTQYFDKIRFDELPPGLDLVIVDGAINSGVSQSIKWVQRALGIQADGSMGTVTMQRIQEHDDHDLLIAQILARREAFLKSLKTFWRFGKGWLNRTGQLRKKGQAWAMGSVGPAVVYVPNGNKKASIIDAKPLPQTFVPDSLAAGGTVQTALGTATQTLAPVADASPMFGQVLLGLTVLGGVALAVGAAWAWWARRQRAELDDALDLTTEISSALQPEENADVPEEVLVQYEDPNKRGSETGNVAPGHTSVSGRVAGETEDRSKGSVPTSAERAPIGAVALETAGDPNRPQS
jgi:lysozyme family protein